MEDNNNQTPAPKNAALSLSRLIVYIVYLIAVFIEVILLLRVALLFFSANPLTPFVNFVYSTSNYFMAPFRGIFPAHPAELTGGYLDTSALFAALVYLIIVAAIQSLMVYLERRR
jgi:hypothetical protein